MLLQKSKQFYVSPIQVCGMKFIPSPLDPCCSSLKPPRHDGCGARPGWFARRAGHAAALQGAHAGLGNGANGVCRSCGVMCCAC